MAHAARTAIPPQIVPLTPERWPDLEQLFGPNGAHSHCWCMWWRLTNAEFNACLPTERHARLRAVATTAAHPPGLLAYREGLPVGWCAIAPRPNFPRLDRSRDWRPLDEQPVWSLNCFFIAAKHRRSGVATALLHAAIDFAAHAGATIVEAYPRETVGTVAAAAIYTGTATMFLAAGFTEVARRTPERPMMRLDLGARQ